MNRSIHAPTSNSFKVPAPNQYQYFQNNNNNIINNSYNNNKPGQYRQYDNHNVKIY